MSAEQVATDALLQAIDEGGDATKVVDDVLKRAGVRVVVAPAPPVGSPVRLLMGSCETCRLGGAPPYEGMALVSCQLGEGGAGGVWLFMWPDAVCPNWEPKVDSPRPQARQQGDPE